MSLTVLQAKDELAGMLHGTTLDDVHNQFGVFNRAARQLLLDCDPFETKQETEITNAIYNKVYNYSAPSDLKMNKVIDLRAQNRDTSDNFDQRFSERFDLKKSNQTFNVEYINGVKTLRVSKTIQTPTTITGFNSTTGWSVGDDATNLTKDTQYYVSAGSSLNFDLDGSTTSGYIENSSLSTVDLSKDEDIAALFMYVYMSDSSIITNVILRWGNDSSNYWTATATTQHFGSFQNGWNLLRFDWNGATEVGSPVSTAVDYVRVTVTYDGTAETDIRVDSLTSDRGVIYDLYYYGNKLFQDADDSSYKATVDNDDDTIILEEPTMNVYLFKVAEMMAQQAQQQGASIDVTYYSQQYELELKRYKSQYPSEAIKPKTFYYNPRQIDSLPLKSTR